MHSGTRPRVDALFVDVRRRSFRHQHSPPAAAAGAVAAAAVATTQRGFEPLCCEKNDFAKELQGSEPPMSGHEDRRLCALMPMWPTW